MRMYFILSFLIVLHFSCSKNVVTGRRQINLIPEREIINMNLTEYNVFLNQNKKLSEYNARVVQVKKYYRPD